MCFFNKINNNTIVDTLKQLRYRIDCKVFCTNVPQTKTFNQDMSHGNRKSTQLTSRWISTTKMELPVAEEAGYEKWQLASQISIM